MYYKQKIQKLKQNSKALSPVVASIILIAVTVAVSIAVAAWMGGLAGNFMTTEELKITGVNINADTETATISVSNSGSTAVAIQDVWIGNYQANVTTGWTSIMTGNLVTGALDGNKQGTIQVTAPDGSFDVGSSYTVKITTTKGTNFQYNAIAS